MWALRGACGGRHRATAENVGITTATHHWGRRWGVAGGMGWKKGSPQGRCWDLWGVETDAAGEGGVCGGWRWAGAALGT